MASRSQFLGENSQMNCSRTQILLTSQGRRSINSGSIISLNSGSIISLSSLKWNHRESPESLILGPTLSCSCSVGYSDLEVFAEVHTATSAWHSARETWALRKGDHWSSKMCSFGVYIKKNLHHYKCTRHMKI